MKKIVLFASLVLMLTACCAYRHIGTNTTTSQKIEVKESVKIVPYLVTLEIPEIKETVRTRDTSSHLENKYAYSDAIVHSDGTLEHSLATKPQDAPQIIDVPVTRKDSIVYVDTIVEKTIEVPREMNRWQRFQIGGFWVLAGLLVLFIVIKFVL